MDNIDIDRIVDYRSEYLSVIQKGKVNGDSVLGLCPFHDDHNASFNASTKTGMYHCFSCGVSGNFVNFWSHLYNVDTKEAYKQILEKYHIESERKKRSYTVSDYAADKRLPEDWLLGTWHLESKTESDGVAYIKIPYFDEKGVPVLFRKRFPKGAATRFKWGKGSSGKIRFYGEQFLPAMRSGNKTVIIVEGESDTQALTYLGFNALGVPGALMFKPEWCEALTGIETVYLHIEPDQGGEHFLDRMTAGLHDGGYTGTVKTFSCKSENEKDPSDLLIKYGRDTAYEKVRKLLEEAEAFDLSRISEELPAAIEGQPIRLKQPEGFHYSDKGVTMIEEKTMRPILICRTPILITRRLRGIDTGDERVELSFLRDGEWTNTIQNRSVVFQARSISVLSDLGCMVTSENARFVVRFLEKLEEENVDAIPLEERASGFGWLSSTRFLPGHAPGVTVDIDPSFASRAAALSQSGTLDDWVDMISPHRNRERFRFILAASFAAPLLRVCKQRSFMVYNWGGSKGGKTAALKAAMSVWGDPNRLMMSFNATTVSLERTAALMSDMPLGIDERQQATGGQKWLDAITYMLANGVGRMRGAKSGGLQTVSTWRTVALGTGEEPLSGESSQTGVTTRVMELYGAPFENEIDAHMMHQSTAMSYGTAGVEFVRRIIECGDADIKRRFEEVFERTAAAYCGTGAHASYIAIVGLADFLASQWIFGEDEHQAMYEADKMMEEIACADKANASRDVNEDAVDFISDWIAGNKQAFTADGFGPTYGFIKDGFAYIIPTALIKALKDNGFSPKKTRRYMLENGITDNHVAKNGSEDSSGKIRDTVLLRSAPGSPSPAQRYIKVNLAAMSLESDPLDSLTRFCEQHESDGEIGLEKRVTNDYEPPF